MPPVKARCTAGVLRTHLILIAALPLLVVFGLAPAPVSAGFACLSSPCVYGICLDDLNSSFTCYCIDGYTGALCQTNWDECWSSPCLNGATCVDGVASFNCTCPDGFVGDLCEQDVNECLSNPCLNNGTCLDGPNGYVCMCPPGYSGIRCEQDVAVCNATSEARCENGGVCLEGPGMDFTCSCTPGWNGPLCEDPVNECESSPCQHGGVCVDLHASYACACLFGYTGHNCEVELEPCSRNPCLNGALCLLEDGAQVCYCVPDFHGDRCQLQYDECRLGPGCQNGGTCIDGVDEFSCSCPASLTGQRCECLMADDAPLNCSYVAPTLPPTTTPLRWTQNHTTLYSSTRDGKDLNLTTDFLTSSSIFTQPILHLTTIPSTFSTSYSSVTPKTSSITSTIFTNHSLVTSPYPPGPGLTTLIFDGPTGTTSSPGQYTEFVPKPTTPGYGSSVELSVTTATESSIKHPDQALTTQPSIDSTRTSTHTGSQFPVQSVTYTTLSIPIMTTTALNKTTEVSRPQQSTPQEAETWIPTRTPHSTSEMKPPDQTTVIPEKTTISIDETSMDTSSTSIAEISTSSPTAETEKTLTTATDFLWTTDTDVSMTISETLTTVYANSTEMVLPDCSETPCLNGGTCQQTPEGGRCSCRFGWSGWLCEDHAAIKTAAFMGHSYLVHRLSPGPAPDRLGTKVSLLARTLAPSGVLLHAALASDLYMSLYLEDGLLKFQFSCGIQTMVFSEVQLRVNNGFDLHIAASLEILPARGDRLACGASLRVNHTLAMSGEQQSLFSKPDSAGMLLYLGGLPRHLDHPLDTPMPAGVTGCMHSLEIDGSPRHIFLDAMDGVEVSECAALACLSKPCYGGATCMERGDNWTCLCPSGFVGERCDRSVCENNPCQSGATCTPYPGSGFLCLCPLGKHGMFCESDLEIVQPSFSPTVAGLSSFAAYSLPAAVEDSMELRFRFVPSTQDQVGLMLFMGQEGPHGLTSDHLAISFIKGYVVLTWNLGSGPRRIFTPRPLAPRGQRPHSVRVGRSGSAAWLVADNLANVSGSSPGVLSQLNTVPLLYLGGHPAVNFSGLPHDLPLHAGFTGCLLDVELRAGRVSLSLERTRATSGRGVGQCGTSLCHARACRHGAACLPHAATFSCLCPDGWFGPVCGQKFNPCDSSRHNCSNGATCVPLSQGYECDCPLGRAGRYCEIEDSITDVLLTGRRSFVSVGSADLQRTQACLELQVRPDAEHGVLLHVGYPAPGEPFLSLVVRGGILEARVSSGGRRGVMTIRSRRVLARSDWHRVRVCRYGRRMFLWVDGSAHSGALRSSERLPPSGAPIFIGGAPDISKLPTGAVSGAAIYLRGCVRSVSVNWRRLPLDSEHVLDARNVEDCDGTACGGDVCLHGGSCWLDDEGEAYCMCGQGYSGPRCETLMSCQELQCHNKGRCLSERGRQARCHCPAGWGGAFCQDAVALETPHFSGDGYLVLEGGHGAAEASLVAGNLRESRDLSFLYLNYSTTQDNGMILWTAQDDELVGVGIEAGRLKVVWGWRGAGVFVALIPGPLVSDGAWHDIALNFGANVSLWSDQGSVTRSAAIHRPIASGGVFYLGGLPNNRSVSLETRGLFSAAFQGCVQQFAWDQQTSLTDFSGLQGENVGSCELFSP